MRKLLALSFLLVSLLAAVPIIAQDDTATCTSAVSEAFAQAQANCAGVGIGQLCYGSGDVQAIPSYVTADFAFEEAGTLLDISRVETLGTSPYNPETDSYGVARLRIGDEMLASDVLLFGNTFAANNVIPVLGLEMTTNTIANIYQQPTTLSEEIGLLVPGETVMASGRYSTNESLAVDDSTWVRVQSDVRAGWIEAFTLTEDYLLPSLTLVNPQEPQLAPMQSMSFIGGGDDRPCDGALDSGMMVQAPAGQVSLQINGVRLVLAPTTSLYIQAQPNAAMDVFVLEGGINAEFDELSQAVSAGEVVSVPIGLDGDATGSLSTPSPYPNAKVMPLAQANPALSRVMVITPGSDEMLAQADPEVMTDEQAAPPPATVAEPVPDTAPPTDDNQTAPAGTTASSAFASSLQQNGVIRVGVNGTLPGFSVEQNGTFNGFEVDLAREVVRRLFGDEIAIEFVRVSARQRPTALADGMVDLMIRNSSFQPDRTSWGEWTNTFYFVDGQRLMVRADNPASTYNDLGGVAVAVQAGTDAETQLNEIAADLNLTVRPVQGVITDVFAAFTNGEVEALSADWTVLEALRLTSSDPAGYRTIGQPLTEIPWNMIVPPGETDFRDEVDTALLALISDGTWLQLYNQTFNAPLPDSIAIIFTPADGGELVVAEAALPPADDPVPPQEEAAPIPEEAAPPPADESGIPVTGDIPVTIFTNQVQQRTIIVTPQGDDQFQLALRRGGEIVYEAEFRYYDDAGRYENIRNSFEYITFSDTAGQTELGCNREPDIRGFFNGAEFEGRAGC
jgi:ABC-type amino acid transport substrate-binding protein